MQRNNFIFKPSHEFCSRNKWNIDSINPFISITVLIYRIGPRWVFIYPYEFIARFFVFSMSFMSIIMPTGIEHRISRRNFYFNETKGFYCLRNDTADKCLRETKGRKHPYVDPQVISKLRKFFAEHNQKFYELVGEDLGWPEE